MAKRFIRTTSENFNNLSDKSEYNDSIVFIEDTKQIWSNGIYYNCSETEDTNISYSSEGLNLNGDSIKTNDKIVVDSDGKVYSNNTLVVNDISINGNILDKDENGVVDLGTISSDNDKILEILYSDDLDVYEAFASEGIFIPYLLTLLMGYPNEFQGDINALQFKNLISIELALKLLNNEYDKIIFKNSPLHLIQSSIPSDYIYEKVAWSNPGLIIYKCNHIELHNYNELSFYHDFTFTDNICFPSQLGITYDELLYIYSLSDDELKLISIGTFYYDFTIRNNTLKDVPAILYNQSSPGYEIPDNINNVLLHRIYINNIINTPDFNILDYYWRNSAFGTFEITNDYPQLNIIIINSVYPDGTLTYTYTEKGSYQYFYTHGKLTVTKTNNLDDFGWEYLTE